MAWGTITIGRLTLKERDILTDATNANSGERSVKLEGAETVPGATLAEVEAKQSDIMGLIDRSVAVSFSRKSNYDGFYFVNDTNAEYEKWVEGPAQIRWSLSLILIGGQDLVDMEAQIANVVRANDFAQVGERWHAPNIGHYSYQVGTAVPSLVSRTSVDGALAVYRAVPAATTPRWGSSVASFGLGRVRILQGGIERTGTGVNLTTIGWEINNGLVRVQPGTGTTTLFVSCWDSGAWVSKSWDLRVSGTTILPADMRSATVLRNDFEMVNIRVVVQLAADSSRHIVDLSLRRGSRFVEGYMQRPASGTLTVTADTIEAGTAGTGFIRATANDAAGNRYVVGSARSFTGDTTNGGFTKSATTTLDFYIGVELNGSGAVSGDAAADLQNQYIAAMAEKVGVVRR